MGRIMSIPRALTSLTLGGREIPLSPGEGESHLADSAVATSDTDTDMSSSRRSCTYMDNAQPRVTTLPYSNRSLSTEFMNNYASSTRLKTRTVKSIPQCEGKTDSCHAWLTESQILSPGSLKTSC